jgi:surface polysaccharide O-acyltransferase-like enzyme
MTYGLIAGKLDNFGGGLTWESLAVSTWEAVYCISMSIWLLGLFRQRFDRQNSLGQLLSANAYTVYIIHAPLIVGLAYLLRDVTLYPLLKFILVAPLGVGLCFLTSHFLVRHIPLADRVL